MQGFKTAEASSSQLYCHHPSSLLLRGQYYPNRNQTRFSDLGELHHSTAFFQHEDALDLTSGCMFSVKSSNVVIGGSNMQYGTTNTNVGSADIGSSGAGQQLIIYQQQQHQNNGHVENWADSGLVDDNNNNNNNSQHTDNTSTDIDTDDKDQCNRENSSGEHLADHHSMLRAKFRAQDHKTLRRLAQNREAARKSRLRKKAYVQQLENSRVKLLRLEQELQRARQQQGMFINTTSPTPRDQGHSSSSGCLRFEMEYSDWVDEHQRVLNELRSALNSEKSDNELHLLIDGVMAHYDELVRIKSIGAKADVFHMLFGLWKTPVERRFMWLGGFRSSELLKIVKNQLELLTENQLMGIYNLEQSSQQAEDALTEGMKAMQQSVSEILSYNSSTSSAGIGNVDDDYMGHHMAVAMDTLSILEDFLRKADVLKQETLQELQRILTTRQMARALLVRNDFISRLRALSTLWLARPTE